jgi:prepilin-type N-terminal cleavage/methylation domain-containing protein/prepilin-type processing-associated H-X9-DG protein
MASPRFFFTARWGKAGGAPRLSSSGRPSWRTRRFPRRRPPGGFTLIELVVVIAIIAILAAILLPALARGKTKALGIACLNNTRQLQIAWQAYALDNHDHLVPASAPGDNAPDFWVDIFDGLADRANGCTNPSTITQGLLWPYTKSMGIYRCPDQRQVFAGVDVDGDYIHGDGFIAGDLITTTPVLSFTISGRLNGSVPPPSYLSNLEQIVQPDPSTAFVFIDENPYTIGVSGAQFTLPNSPYYTRAGLEPEGWDDVPGVRHGGTATVSFADGHSELHRWLEPSTFLAHAPTGLNPAPGLNGQPNRDIAWVQARSIPTQQ